MAPRGKVFVSMDDTQGFFLERLYASKNSDDWMYAVYESGELSCEWLSRHVIGHVRAVLKEYEDGTIHCVVRRLGYYTEQHVQEWKRIAGDPKASKSDVRACETRLRNSVKYWMVEFPAYQERLMKLFYARYLGLDGIEYYDDPIFIHGARQHMRSTFSFFL